MSTTPTTRREPTPTVTLRVYLVVDADKRVRASRRPQIKPNEVAIAVDLRFPNTWEKTVATVSADVPDFAPTVLGTDIV